MRIPTLWITLCVVGIIVCTGAMGQTIAPADWTRVFAVATPTAGTLTAAATYQYMTYDGRKLSQGQAGLDYVITPPLTLGVAFRSASGHGRAKANTYDADGWGAWGTYQLMVSGACPTMVLLGEYVRDNARLHVENGATAVDADPDVTIGGLQLLARLNAATPTWSARAGVYHTTILTESLATTWLAGAGVRVPLGRTVDAAFTATAFRDDYIESETTVELEGTLCYALPPRTSVTLAGIYFPNGIPLAATPFSSAAAVGAFYGGSATSAIRNDVIGYVALTGTYAF